MQHYICHAKITLIFTAHNRPEICVFAELVTFEDLKQGINYAKIRSPGVGLANLNLIKVCLLMLPRYKWVINS